MNTNPTSDRKLLSVCIPTYEMYGKGHIFLKDSLQRLTKQTFKNFDVVISDYSKNDLIKDVCDAFSSQLDIKYFRNENTEVGMSLNVNNVISCATGKLLKILFLDDFLYNNEALKHTVDGFDLEKDTWLVTACTHTKNGWWFYRPHPARFNKKIHMGVGKNTIGSPSVLTIKKEASFPFDTNLKWFMDGDYYKRLYDAYGEPKIIDAVTVVIRTGDHQITNTEATTELRKKEFDYVTKKFNEKTVEKDVTLVAVSGLNPASCVVALEQSMQGMHFAHVLLIAHTKPENLNPKIEFKQCRDDELASKDPKNTDDWSKFMLYNLHSYIETEYCLIVHKNAIVLRPYKWDYEFLDYDYLGAPWQPNAHFTSGGVNVRVGNGGFSLRSKKLLKALNALALPFTDNGTNYHHDDGVICVYHRKQLEDYGIRFAPVPLASKFSHEKDCLDSDPKPFGFHDNLKVVPPFFFLRFRIRKFLERYA